MKVYDKVRLPSLVPCLDPKLTLSQCFHRVERVERMAYVPSIDHQR